MTWWLAGSPDDSDRPTSTMMKTHTSSSVEASRATFGWKRIDAVGGASAPATIVTPEHQQAVANSEPTIAL